MKTQDKLDLTSFRKGIYYLKITSAEDVQVKRIVLEY
ncbi:T9SS type A sorting domain-containing protein [Catalinimonas locisalis]